MNRYYAGIGSRETPPDVLRLMTSIADYKRKAGQILRSGGADGADMAFETGAGTQKEIFRASSATFEALALAAKHHPAWNRCSNYAKLLRGRNAMIILGERLDKPVFEVVCWTPNASASGGTGQGIRIARHYGIPVLDLAYPEVRKIYEFLETEKAS